MSIAQQKLGSTKVTILVTQKFNIKKRAYEQKKYHLKI